MESASKALLIAAAVLIAILVITVGIKIFTSTSDTQKVATDTGKTISDKIGQATEITGEEISGREAIQYFNGETNNKKDKKEVQPGDTIKIGTEKFMVFSKTTTEIKAMPYYNIELKLDNPKQSESASTTVFSTRAYWYKDQNNNEIENWRQNVVEYNINIDMNNDSNKLQPYINAYNNTLKEISKTAIEARIAYISDIKGTTLKMNNPGAKGHYWLGSSPVFYPETVRIIAPDGCGSNIKYDSTWIYLASGVRPIIIIPVN